MALNKNRVEYNKVRELFFYNPINGDLFWNTEFAPPIKLKNGDPAGCIRDDGYRNVRIENKLFLTHRLVWLFHYGYLPEHDIDHINGNRADNHLGNLREVSRGCNIKNSNNRKDNLSGVKGVCFRKDSNKWRVFINHNKKRFCLGDYSDFISAVKARHKKECELKWSGCKQDTPAKIYLDNLTQETPNKGEVQDV